MAVPSLVAQPYMKANPQNNTENTAVTVSIADATLNGALMSSGFGTVTVDNATINGDVTKDGTGNMGITNSTITGDVTKDARQHRLPRLCEQQD